MLGNALLVAPVLEPGARARTIVLPAGRWYRLWDDAPLDGPGKLAVAAPLDRMPILVRAGAVLPREEQGRLVLHLYPPAEAAGAGQLYSDAGDGAGAWRVDRFELTRRGNLLALAWNYEGMYPLPYAAIEVQVHGMAIRHAWVDGVLHDLDGAQLEVSACSQVQLECAPGG